MNLKKYLPIGTVVILKGGKKRIMITGFCCVDEKNKDKVYDYCGLLYPEGYVFKNQMFLFDHEQIEKIYYLGLNDDENKQFQETLNNYLIKNDEKE